jgi:hypothetical protein
MPVKDFMPQRSDDLRVGPGDEVRGRPAGVGVGGEHAVWVMALA